MNLHVPHHQVVSLAEPDTQHLVRVRPLVKQYDKRKRHATYFPLKESFKPNLNLSDDASTWEFSAPVARNASMDSSSSASSSPAQEIVIRYRAGLSLAAILKDLGSTSTSSSGGSNSSKGKAPLDAASIASKHAVPVPEQQVRLIYRRSRCDEQVYALEEAVSVMRRDGRRENEYMVCHRRGCRDTVPNVRALMYHLDIHNIHDQIFKCGSCKKRFDGPSQMALHRCHHNKPQFRSSASPITVFLRSITKNCCLPLA